MNTINSSWNTKLRQEIFPVLHSQRFSSGSSGPKRSLSNPFTKKYITERLSRENTNKRNEKRKSSRTEELIKKRMQNLRCQRLALSASEPTRSPVNGRRCCWREITQQHYPPPDTESNTCGKSSRLCPKFRVVGAIALTLIRLKSAIIANSYERTKRSAVEMQWLTLCSQQHESETMVFSKSYFSREKIKTRMPTWALQILELSPDNRTENHCRRLHTLFKGMNGYDKFTEEIQLNLCRAFSYIRVSENRVIVRRGHVGIHFYFVYSGSVFVNVLDVDNKGNTFVRTENVLGKGDCFGELALLQNIRRTATVSVRESCELLVANRDVFSDVCTRIFERELIEKRCFLRRLSLFSSTWWTGQDLNALCLQAQIHEGKCQIIRCLTGKAKNYELQHKERKLSNVLSDEITQLLSSNSAKKEAKSDDESSKSSKEQMLSSLYLKYIDTEKKGDHRVMEVDNVTSKNKRYISMTLTSLISQQKREGNNDTVYIVVGRLESEDVFDIASLDDVSTKHRSSTSLLLVSCGARMLRIKKHLFHKLSSVQAIEHTKTLISRQQMPTEKSVLESYIHKIKWNAHKMKEVKRVLAACKNTRDSTCLR